MRSKPQPPLAQQISQIQNLLLEGKIIEAEHQAQNLLQEVPNNEEVHLLIAKICQELGKVDVSATHLNHLLQLNQHHAEANKLLANHHFNSSDFDAALTHINIALAQSSNSEAQELKGLILSGLHEYDKAIETLLGVIDSAQDSWLTWNNLANQHRNLGLFKEAKEYYLKAIELSGSNDIPYNNLITFLHYLPDSKKNELKSLYNNWEEKYSRNGLATKHQADIKFKNKTIRIGMISDGFRSHPVGQMITSALEELPENEIELYLYSTNSTEDQLTYRTKKASEKWMAVTHLSEEKLAQEFINDKIDILFDLCGHNNGCRIRTMVMKPAPILVKWVGGLINTTGLSTMDYLLSDNIETPAGEDEFYTEKLIRMPDDYICYDAPIYTPDIYSPPEKRNGHITLGCFNNPTKLNTVLLAEWAKIMHSLPESRLFLKGFQFSSEVLRENIRNQLKDLGINENRVLIEGPSHHEELLKSYNKVDIALDTWPYSGGLTTCEAMYMGVPVVTYPGPTFAGRHSATHLTNAGMPQLVAESWKHYHDLVVMLASDIDNLANIRQHLRNALLESPVCDAKRFARNFSNAMRAIWQRHCEGKQPAALTLDKDGNAQFEDEGKPVVLQFPEEPVLVEDDDFHFRFNGKIVVLDNGASFSSISSFIDLHKIGVLSTLCFDPGNRIANAQQLKQTGDFQHVPMTTLGNGEQVMLSITQDPAYSGTLLPLDLDQQPEQTALKYQQIAQVPVNTIRLDDIAGINTLEWLVLDNLNNLDVILANGENTLAHPLLVQIRVNYLPTHHGQPTLANCQQRMNELGFDFHGLFNQHKVQACATHDEQLLFADAVFIPNAGRCTNLSTNQHLKLAFLLHTIYQSYSCAYRVLSESNSNLAEYYRDSLSEVEQSQLAQTIFTDTDSLSTTIHQKLNVSSELNVLGPKNIKTEKKQIIHICFNNIHTNSLVAALCNAEFEDYEHYIYIEKGRTINCFDVDISKNKKAYFFEIENQLNEVIGVCNRDLKSIIFIHGLFFSWQEKLINKINNKIIIWSIWGGDLYSNKIKNSHVIKKITHVATVEDGDYELFCEKYSYKPHIKFRYPPSVDFHNIKERRKENLIFIGNSGDPSNNHIEIIKSLSKKKNIKNYRIVIPAAYNMPEDYKNEILSCLIDNRLYDATTILDSFQKTESYFNHLSGAKFLITAHDRQQGVGTISTALYFGLHVVIKKIIKTSNGVTINPVWKSLNEKNKIKLIDFNDFINDSEILNVKEKKHEEVKRVREKINLLYGVESSLKTLNNSVMNLCDETKENNKLSKKTSSRIENILELAREWERIWEQRPFDNNNGLGCQGSFALFYFLRNIKPKPELVFEIGTWRGFSTWVIKQALPDAKIICSDPILASRQFMNQNMFQPEYRLNEVDYTWQDFSNIEFYANNSQREKTVVFFDDHQNKITRINQAKEKGIKHIIFDDNVPFNYTHKTIENHPDRDNLILEFLKYEIFKPIFNGRTRDGLNFCGILDEKYKDELKNFFNGKDVYSWVTKVEINIT